MDHAGHQMGATTAPSMVDSHHATAPSSPTHHMMMMPMVFTADVTGFKVLFSVWTVDEAWQFFITLVACFFIAFGYEILRVYRQNHFIRDCKSRKRFMCFGGVAASLPASPRPTSDQAPEAAFTCCHAEVPNIPEKAVEGNCCSKGENGKNDSGELGAVLLNTSKDTNGEAAAARPCATMKRQSLLSRVHVLQTVMHIVLTTLGFLIMLAVMTFNIWVFLAVIAGVGVGYFVSGHRLESPVDANSCCM